jgi:hypothetical protein
MTTKMHFAAEPQVTACGRSAGNRVSTSRNVNDVTCGQCRQTLAYKDAKFDAAMARDSQDVLDATDDL